MSVKRPHIWKRATILKVFVYMWPIDFLENHSFWRFFNRDVENLHIDSLTIQLCDYPL